MLVVPDIDNIFLPLSEQVVFVKYADCKTNVDILLEKLPVMFASSKVNDSSFGAAIEGAAIAMVFLNSHFFLTFLEIKWRESYRFPKRFTFRRSRTSRQT
jgi:hypothetical protein